MTAEEFDELLDPFLEGALPEDTLGFHLIYIPNEGAAIAEIASTVDELATRVGLMRQLGPGQIIVVLGRRIWTTSRAEYLLLPDGPVALTRRETLDIDPTGSIPGD